MSFLTDQVTRFTLNLELESVPADARACARTALLDTLACGVGARDTRTAGAVREFVLEEGNAERASVWGTSTRTSPTRAALANGTAAHALDFDDVSWAMSGHPSVPLVPAVLALGESTDASGADVLAAYVVGFEVEARLGRVLGDEHYERGWHPTATLGALGATAAASRLLGLNEDGLRRAIGLACSQLAGSRMNFGTDVKPLHAGLAAQTGVMSAELAARGFTARLDALDAEMGPADLYHGRLPTEALPFGNPFALLDPGVEIKPYPSCRFTHRIIDGVLAIRSRNPGETPERIHCAVTPLALKVLIHPRPTDGLEAKFSLPYCAAVAWIDGWPTVESFSDARAGAGDVQDLLQCVDVRESSDAEEEVEILFASGRRDSERIRYARGNPKQPLSLDEHTRKVRSLCEPILGVPGTDRLVRCVQEIESLPSVRELARALTPGA
jgi:2-methylcitrate dehydratase PrpD